MKEIGIILISHGYYAQYAMQSAEMIVGDQENYEIVSVTDDKDLEIVTDELRKAYEKLNDNREIIVLADIFGGTPCNACSTLLLQGANIEVYTGFNLPVLLELLLNRDLPIKEIIENLTNVYNETFISLKKKLSIES